MRCALHREVNGRANDVSGYKDIADALEADVKRLQVLQP